MVELRVRLGSKGQVVIPKILREAYGLYPQQEVAIEQREEGVILKKPVSNDPIKVLEEIARISSQKRKGKKLIIHPHDIYEQYDKRARRAGL